MRKVSNCELCCVRPEAPQALSLLKEGNTSCPRSLTAGRPGRERWSSGLALFPGESTGELSSFVEAEHGRVGERKSQISPEWPRPMPWADHGPQPYPHPSCSCGALVLSH